MNFINKLNYNYIFMITGVLLLLNLIHLDSKFGTDFGYTFATVLVIIGASLTIFGRFMLQFILKKN